MLVLASCLIVIYGITYGIVAIVYLYGPATFGFWQGLPSADICAHVTFTPTSIWLDEHNAANCDAIIRRKILGIFIIFNVVFLTHGFFNMCWSKIIKMMTTGIISSTRAGLKDHLRQCDPTHCRVCSRWSPDCSDNSCHDES